MSLYGILKAKWRVSTSWTEFLKRHPKAEGQNVLDEYTTTMPSHQNAVDALPGWNHTLPEQTGVTAGLGSFYNDPRIHWALDQYGDIKGRRVLELGPLEASHTYIIDQKNPGIIHSIEANKLSFLRCLVVKEILELKKAKFLLGNFEEWLKRSPERYDLVIASGVLYHMEDPIRLLELISSKTDAFYLWTHYMSDSAMPPQDPRRGAFLGAAETVVSHGVIVHLHKRSYHGAWRDKAFCGGMRDIHRWIDRDDILALISALGFDDVRIQFDEPDHPNGPSFSLFARKSTSEIQNGAGRNDPVFRQDG